MNAADLDRLAALAEAATPGPWGHVDSGEFSEVLGGDDRREVATTLDWDDAAFIAACDPATVTALIERIRELEASVGNWTRIAMGDS